MRKFFLIVAAIAVIATGYVCKSMFVVHAEVLAPRNFTPSAPRIAAQTAELPIKSTENINFRKTYTAGLTGDRQLSVTVIAHPWLDDFLSVESELIQADGKRVDFDCNAIADKIIYADLVAEITPLCPVLIDRGQKYWQTHGYVPDEFVDVTGVKWARVK